MKKSLTLLLSFVFLLIAGSVKAQTCPTNVTSIGGQTSCWVPPSTGYTISDLTDSNPLTIAGDSTFALQSGNTIGCGTASSTQPSGITSGCDLQSNVTYSPSTLTLVMKFAGTGGPLAQFGNISSVSAAYQYFELYLDSYGRLTWGAYNYGSLNTLQSGSPDKPQVFADGNPHIVVASIGSNGMRLYADGSLIGTNNLTLANYAQGYWLFGNAYLTGAQPSGNAWPYSPPQPWFNGTLYYWAWWNGTQLTDTQAETLSNPGSNPPPPITNNYVTLTGNLASLSQTQGYAYANQPVTFKTQQGQLPACGSTIPLAATSQIYYTDNQGNLPSTVQLPQGAHVNMIWANTTTPLVLPCMSTIPISELIPAQNPLPDAVSAVDLLGPLYQGTTVSNPAVGTIGPATLTAPGTVAQNGTGSQVTINRNLGPQQTVTLTASTPVTFSNMEDGAPQLIVDVIEGGSGGYSPTFSAPAGFTLQWPGGLGQPSQPSTAVGIHTFYGFIVEGTTIFGSITATNTGTGTFPLTATANAANFSITNVNSENLPALTAPALTVTATCSSSCSTSYSYELVCLGDNGTHSAVGTLTTAANNSTLSGTNYNVLTWPTQTGCYSGYSVYGRIGGSLGLLATVSPSTTSYTDNSLSAPGAAPPTGNTTGTLTASAVNASVNNVINAAIYGAIGNGSTDNSTAFAAALAAVGSQGTLFIPKGTYTWNTATALALTKANCNVTIRGDSEGGTILVPNFSNADAISFIDSVSETPSDCSGGVRDVNYQAPSSIPTNLNLIHVSNILGLTLEHIHASGFTGSGDSTINLDPGVGPAGTTFTERTTMFDIKSLFVTNMLTLNGNSTASTSLNNNELLGSHCDPSGTGSCINIIGMTNAGVLGGDIFEFNADLNAAGQSVVSSNHLASDMNGTAEFAVRAQSTTTSANYCFNAPASSGTWTILGYVQCLGPDMVQEKNSNPVRFAIGSSGIEQNNLTMNGPQISITDPAAGGEDLNFTNAAGTANYWTLNGGFSGGVQGNFGLYDAGSSTYALVAAPTSDAVSTKNNTLDDGSTGRITIKGDITTNPSTTPALSVCNGAGSSISGSDFMGRFTTQTSATNTCTLTKSGSACPTNWLCMFTDGNSSHSGNVYSTGATTSTTAIVDFTSSANQVIMYVCSCQ